MADPLLLVVEGSDDKHVILALVAHHGFEPEFEIRDGGGYESLCRQLVAVHLKQGIHDRLGIVVDADEDVLGRWQSIRSILVKAGYADVPDRPDPAGTVVGHDFLPRVGVWIMPDNTVPGMLEDYLAFLVPAGDGLIERARRAVEEIPAQERRFVASYLAKAHLHTWLAWQENPGTPLGQAITKRYFNSEDQRVTVFLAWLTRVFA